MSNFKRLSFVVIFVLFGLLVSGCLPAQKTELVATATAEKPESTEPPATSTSEPTNAFSPAEKSQIVILIAEDPPSFNPSVTDTGYDGVVMEMVMLGLADMDDKGKVFPELAVELPTEENSGVVIDEENGTMDVTWNLRDDIVWADGHPVTSDDIVFTYNALTDPEKGWWYQGLDYIDSLEKIDDRSFVIHYNTIYPDYLLQFGGEQMVVWPAHYCDASQGFAEWDCAQEPLSNGPYILKEWIAGDRLTFERNPRYYEQDKPSINTVIVRVVPDETERKTMLINGEADVLVWASEDVVAELLSYTSINLSASPTSRWTMRLFFNLAAKGTVDPEATPHPILSDVRVRRAIRQAIDVDIISNDVFESYAQPTWTEFYLEPYRCSIPRPEYDPLAAAALLEGAGWKDQDGDGVRECHGCQTAKEGYRMEMDFLTYAEYGKLLDLTQQVIVEMLSKIGIQLNPSLVEGDVLWGTVADGGIEQTGNFDIDLWDDGYSGIDPSDFLWELYSTDASKPDVGWNIGRWSNPEFDGLLAQTYTLDLATRQDLFCQMATILDEELPSIPLFTVVNADAYLARLQGIHSSANDLVTWNIADWVIK